MKEKNQEIQEDHTIDMMMMIEEEEEEVQETEMMIMIEEVQEEIIILIQIGIEKEEDLFHQEDIQGHQHQKDTKIKKIFYIFIILLFYSK